MSVQIPSPMMFLSETDIPGLETEDNFSSVKVFAEG